MKAPKPLFSLRKENIRKLVRAESPVAASGCVFFGSNRIGAFTYAGKGSVVHTATIGRYCSIGTDVYVGLPTHNMDTLSTHPFASGDSGPFARSEEYALIKASVRKKPANKIITRIGNDVWIGTNATILGGVTVGNGAVIGAGAVVTKDVAPYSIAAGVPARHIRSRFPAETVDKLLKLQWWNYDLSSLSKTVDFSDIAAVINALERGLTDGTLTPLRPQVRAFAAPSRSEITASSR